jgi:hypothetical protein
MMIKIQTLEEIRANRNSKVGLPPRERFGEPVPRGGSMCSNCEYLADRIHGLCREPNFIAWEGRDKDTGVITKPAGSDRIPGRVDEYCSIWWHAEEKK